MKTAFLSRFTPSLMPQELLEAVFVQRERLAKRTVEHLRESIITDSKSYTLLVGQRGIGKTHLVSLIYHRLRKMDDLQDKMLVAWLREEEWGLSSFLDLLLSILRALSEENADLELNIDALYKQKAAEAERMACKLLIETLSGRTLVLIAENLDDLFDGLGDEGQKSFRAFIQETRSITILATVQGLFQAVSLQTSPFYGFFQIRHLPGLDIEDARTLLIKIAELEQDTELAAYLQTPAGKARVRAVHHLAGGNPRLYVTFSEFLTRESLDELVPPFMEMLDDLTPYYQAKMRMLSAQQRKIVEVLSDARGAIPVKEIALRSFITPQSVSNQLKELRGKGYVQAHPIGRDSYYELQEPLMRLCLDVKKQHGEPIRLFVDFLRIWYSRNELEQRLKQSSLDNRIDRLHLTEALKDSDRILESRENTSDVDQLIHTDENYFLYWKNKGVDLFNVGKYEDAVYAYGRAAELNPYDGDTWFTKGFTLYTNKKYLEAIYAYEQCLPLFFNLDAMWNGIGLALVELKRIDDAVIVYNMGLQINKSNFFLYANKISALRLLGQWKESIDLTKDAFSVLNKNAGTIIQCTVGHLNWIFEDNPNAWETRITELLNAYEDCIMLLSGSLVISVHRLKSPLISPKTRRKWCEIWHSLAGELPEFSLTLHLLDIAIKHINSGDTPDERLLLSLSIEERALLEPLLKLSISGDHSSSV